MTAPGARHRLREHREVLLDGDSRHLEAVSHVDHTLPWVGLQDVQDSPTAPVRERMEQEVRVVVSKSNHMVTYSAWGRGGARGFSRRADSGRIGRRRRRGRGTIRFSKSEMHYVASRPRTR